MEKKKIVIKLATIQDAVSIALLGRVTFTETFGTLFSDRKDLLDYLERTFSVSKIKNGLQKEDNIFFIAFVGELPVGYGKLKLHSENEFLQNKNICQLQKIYVLQDFISLRIGLKLQNKLLETAVNKRFNTIWLSVLDSNQRAIDFYKKSNFKVVGTHDYFIGKEDFKFNVMQKELK